MHTSLRWPYASMIELHRLVPDRLEGLHRLFLYGAPLAIAVAAALAPPDANFDLANYHWYNGWAILTGQHRPGFAPAGTANFYNPLLDIPFAWANMHLPGRVVAFLLGLAHSACFALLYLLARTLAFRAETTTAAAAAGAVALAGITAAVSITEIGTTFYDAIGAAGVLLVLLHLVRHTLDRDAGLGRVILAGAVLGAVTGLKLTNGIYAGIAVAIPFLSPNQPQRALVCTAAFVISAIAGLLATGGMWMIHLAHEFGNPIYPYFNNVFQAPLAPFTDGRDLRFLPRGWLETLFYPVVFTIHPTRTIEVTLRDLRFLAFFLAIPAGAAILIANRQHLRSYEENLRRNCVVFLLIALTASYATWLAFFAIRRYGLALEMLAPLLVLAVGMEWPAIGKKVAAGVILVLVLTTMPATMGRGTWSKWNAPLVAATLPHEMATDHSQVVMIGWRPKAFLVPFFPTSTNFLDAGPRQLKSPGARAELARRIAVHHGPHFVLVHQTEKPALAALQALGLAAGSCRPIRSTLDLKGPVLLCPASRV